MSEKKRGSKVSRRHTIFSAMQTHYFYSKRKLERTVCTLGLCHRIACSTFNRIHNITHSPLLFALIAEHVLPSTVQWQAAAEKSTRTAPPSYGEAGVTYRPYKPRQKEGGRGDREGGGHGRRKSLQGDRGRRKGESAGGAGASHFRALNTTHTKIIWIRG